MEAPFGAISLLSIPAPFSPGQVHNLQRYVVGVLKLFVGVAKEFL